MKKAIKKNVNYLRRLIGHKIIRTKETAIYGDFSYTSDPVILKGFTEKGEMIIQLPKESIFFKLGECKLPIEFTDRNWKLYNRVRKVGDNKLNKWKGKKILRTVPTKHLGDRSYMDEPVKLITASKYHIIFEFTEPFLQGKSYCANYDFSNPKEWKLEE